MCAGSDYGASVCCREAMPAVCIERNRCMMQQGNIIYPRVVNVDARPTWKLAWGLFWRMAILQGLVFGGIYALVYIVVLSSL